MITDRLHKAIGSALEAVSVVQDPELRKIAFGKAIDWFLEDHELVDSKSDSAEAPARKESSSPGSDVRRSPVMTGPSSWVDRLHVDGFFVEPRTISDVVERLLALGRSVKSKDVTFPLVRLVKLGRLMRNRKVTDGSKRRVWVYINC
jgi:hypothetical protein